MKWNYVHAGVFCHRVKNSILQEIVHAFNNVAVLCLNQARFTTNVVKKNTAMHGHHAQFVPKMTQTRINFIPS